MGWQFQEQQMPEMSRVITQAWNDIQIYAVPTNVSRSAVISICLKIMALAITVAKCVICCPLVEVSMQCLQRHGLPDYLFSRIILVSLK